MHFPIGSLLDTNPKWLSFRNFSRKMFETMNYLIVHKTVYRKFSHGTCVLQNADKRQTDDVMTVAELK